MQFENKLVCSIYATLGNGAGGSAVVESLDFGAKGPEFKSHPGWGGQHHCSQKLHF